MISVLISTYNGEPYILEQLRSLNNQTVPADQVVIVDDCSKDRCVEVARHFIEDNKLGDRWSLICNEHNKGWKANFREGLKFITGDVLFFCDQDDIWEHSKIEKMMEVFSQYPDAMVLGTNLFHFTDNISKVTPEGIIDKRIIKVEYDPECTNFLEHPAGCTMAIKSEFIEKVKAYYADTWAHDEFFWRFATVSNCCYLIRDSYIYHRISGKNVTSQKTYSTKNRADGAYCNVVNYQLLLEYSNKECNSNYSKVIAYFISGNQKRYQFLTEHKLSDFAYLLVFYRKIYYKLKQLFGDAYAVLGEAIHK